MCVFPSKFAAIKAPISAKAAAFIAECKREGKNVYEEWRKQNKEGK